MTTYNTSDGEGWQSLHVNQLLDRFDYAVESGCSVSINSGALGNADTLTVASGSIVFDGSSVSVPAQDVGIGSSNGEDPRKDVVYIDSNGDAQVATGTPEAKEPSSANRFETFRPAPLDLSGTKATVIAEVWVPSGASGITSSDLRDRRIEMGGGFDEKVVQGVVYAGHSDFVDLEEAIDWADTNGYGKVLVGSDHSFSDGYGIPDEMALISTRPFGVSGGPELSNAFVEGEDVTFQGFHLSNFEQSDTAFEGTRLNIQQCRVGASTLSDRFVISNSRIRNYEIGPVDIQAYNGGTIVGCEFSAAEIIVGPSGSDNRVTITGNYSEASGADITLDGNNNVVAGNAGANVTDNGSGNQVANNT